MNKEIIRKIKKDENKGAIINVAGRPGESSYECAVNIATFIADKEAGSVTVIDTKGEYDFDKCHTLPYTDNEIMLGNMDYTSANIDTIIKDIYNMVNRVSEVTEGEPFVLVVTRVNSNTISGDKYNKFLGDIHNICIDSNITIINILQLNRNYDENQLSAIGTLSDINIILQGDYIYGELADGTHNVIGLISEIL